jgi:hypothetical protein
VTLDFNVNATINFQAILARTACPAIRESHRLAVGNGDAYLVLAIANGVREKHVERATRYTHILGVVYVNTEVEIFRLRGKIFAVKALNPAIE